MTKVDPEIMIPNYGIKAETEDFLRKNPWAHEFDPKQKYNKVKIFQHDQCGLPDPRAKV